MRFNDAIVGAVLLLLAAAMMAYTRTFPPMPGQKYGPALFPMLIGIALSICAIMLIIMGLRRRRSDGWVAWAPWTREPGQLGGVALVLGAIGGYIWLSETVGFLLLASLLLLLLLMFFGLRWPRAMTTALAVVVFAHVAFYSLLRVPLPWGLLTPLAW